MWRIYARNCLFTQRQLILRVGLWMTGLLTGPGVLGNSGWRQVRQKPLPAPLEPWPLPFSSSTLEAFAQLPSPAVMGSSQSIFQSELHSFGSILSLRTFPQPVLGLGHHHSSFRPHIISFVPKSPAAFSSPAGLGSPSLCSCGILSGDPAPNKQLIWLYEQEVMWHNS